MKYIYRYNILYATLKLKNCLVFDTLHNSFVLTDKINKMMFNIIVQLLNFIIKYDVTAICAINSHHCV